MQQRLPASAGASTHEAAAAAAAFRELGAVRHHALARVLGLIATIHAAPGDRDAARQGLRDALSTQRHASLADNLAGLLEKVAAMHPDAPAAPALLGTASAVREQQSVPVFPAEREECENCHAQVRAAHGASEYERAFAAGRTLEREKAIDSALALLEGHATTALR